MKITLNGKTLSRELAALKAVMPSRPALAVLGTVKVTAQSNSMLLHASDLDRHLECQIECGMSSPDLVEFCIRPDRLAMFPHETVEIKWGNNVATIRGGNQVSRVPTLAASEFPEWPAADREAKIYGPFPAEDMASVYASALSTASTDASRHIITAPALYPDGYLVATNGRSAHRVFWANITPEHETILSPNPITPAMGGDECMVSITATSLVIDSGNRRYITRRIDGQFPNVKMAVPGCWEDCGKEKWAKLQRSDLIDAISALSGVSDDSCKSAGIKSLAGALKIWTRTKNDERHEITIPVTGSDFDTIGVSLALLIGVVRAANKDEIEFGVIGPMDPICVKSECRSILMPLRTPAE